MRPSRILRDHSQKGVATCLKSNLADPRIIEIAGLAGFSCVWLCNEHVPTEWTTFENCVRAGKIHDVDIIVRVSKGSYSEYIKPFEADAAAIMVPHVTSAREAREIVDMCRFRPLGNRALDGGNSDGAFCQIPMEEYIAASNREKLIIIQIESPEAVEAVDEIAAVEGYECLLFGPGDYAHRIGKPGQVHDPEVLAAREKVEIAARRHGKMGFSVGAKGTPHALIEKGYGILTLGADVVALANSFKEMIASMETDMARDGGYYDK